MGSTDEVRGPVIGTREDKSTKGTFLIYLELSSRGEKMKVDPVVDPLLSCWALCGYLHMPCTNHKYEALHNIHQRQGELKMSCAYFEKGFLDLQRIILIFLRDQRDRKNSIRSMFLSMEQVVGVRSGAWDQIIGK